MQITRNLTTNYSSKHNKLLLSMRHSSMRSPTVVSSDTQLKVWKQYMMEDITSIKLSGRKADHYKNSTGSRACLFLTCTVPCGLCVFWSSLWRVLCCPISGCQDNACTAGSDKCLAGCCDSINVQTDTHKLLTGYTTTTYGSLTKAIVSSDDVRAAVLDVLRAAKDVLGATNAQVDIGKSYSLLDIINPIINDLNCKCNRFVTASAFQSLLAEVIAEVETMTESNLVQP